MQAGAPFHATRHTRANIFTTYEYDTASIIWASRGQVIHSRHPYFFLWQMAGLSWILQHDIHRNALCYLKMTHSLFTVQQAGLVNNTASI
jgi:hypothetical protein